MLIFSDKCSEDWLTWDNSCYKLETSSNLRVSDNQGMSHCESAYNGHLIVPNSVKEAVFLSEYMSGVSVSFFEIVYRFIVSAYPDTNWGI